MDCWSCGAERDANRFCPTCGKIQPVSDRDSLFDALGLKAKMAQPRLAVESAFREVSKTVHPDLFGHASSVERKLALRATEQVNFAYRTLKDVRTRAEYLMKLRGVEIGAQDSRTKDPAFLMEMMELQEQVEDTQDDDALEDLQSQVQGRYDGLLGALTRFFDAETGTQDDAVHALDELRYLRRLLERLDDKLEELD